MAEPSDKKKREKKKGEARFKAEDAEEWKDDTLPGHLKDFSKPMEDSYHPTHVEASWDAYWEAQGFYKPIDDPKAEKFVMVIPPPNVTGTLHLGHALTVSIEDCISRWHRMNGKSVLWVPGTDHAGIATQVVVEKKLKWEENKSRHDLGRDNFVKRVWEWKRQNGSTIYRQIRRLGASVDWSRERFTMDDMLSNAVRTAFIRLFQDGLIYRENRLVNWSCTLNTAISQIEVEPLEIDGSTMVKVPGYEKPVEVGVIHHFTYKFVDGTGEIEVATTRLETMLGDVAVAVHPADKRFKGLVGKRLNHPFLPDRVVTIIADEMVDPEFGSGAVKITPAHDPKDFQCGKRHNLPFINIFENDGTITKEGGPYAGKKRFDVREEILRDLTKIGQYKGKKANKMVLGQCSRSKDIVEPLLRPQWYVNCKGMSKQALDAAESGELKIIPEFHKKTWADWLGNPQDWCISRQLWWGHRIPAYKVSLADSQGHLTELSDETKHWVVADDAEQALAKAREQFKGKNVVVKQDEDVLDTWFSSGLFPFSTMGWPDNTPDLRSFYPGTLLETGMDILFFWVARMVMMGLQLTKQLPFTTVYLHAMVRDKYGRKMSKSKGNVIDPLDVMRGISLEELHDMLRRGNLDPSELTKATLGQKKDFPDGIPECGADALRFGLLSYTSQGRDISLDINKVAANRQYCNKLWNATKFALQNFKADFKRPRDNNDLARIVTAGGNFTDRWILSRLSRTVDRMNADFTAYEFGDLTATWFKFFKDDLCDRYLEMIKPTLRSEDPSFDKRKQGVLATLFTCIEYTLLLLHPIMPFVTEELYHRLPDQPKGSAAEISKDRAKSGSIMVQRYPNTSVFKGWESDQVERQFEIVDAVSAAARASRANLPMAKHDRIPLYIASKDAEILETVKLCAHDIASLSLCSPVTALLGSAKPPAGCVAAAVEKFAAECHLNVQGLDFTAEIVRMEGRLENLKDDVEKVSRELSNKQKPADQKTKDAEQHAKLMLELQALQASHTQLSSSLTPAQISKYFELKINTLMGQLSTLAGQVEKAKAKGSKKSENSTQEFVTKMLELEARLAGLRFRQQQNSSDRSLLYLV